MSLQLTQVKDGRGRDRGRRTGGAHSAVRACRQALVAFGAEVRAGFPAPDGNWTVVTADALLPHRFVLPER